MLCRNKERGEHAVKEVKEITSNESVFLSVVDVSLLKSIKRFSDEINEKGEKVDVLVCKRFPASVVSYN